MPLDRYFAGKGPAVMKKMKRQYGGEVGERVFYATYNKHRRTGAGATRPKQKVNPGNSAGRPNPRNRKPGTGTTRKYF